jgi:hypothetical protein
MNFGLTEYNRHCRFEELYQKAKDKVYHGNSSKKFLIDYISEAVRREQCVRSICLC